MHIFRKYAWVIPAKNKQGTTITNAIQKKLDRSKGKPSKIWVNKGSEFYNRSIKSWLEKNNIEMYSTLWKSTVAERFLRTSKTKIFLNLIKIFATRYTPIWSEVVFVIRNLKLLLHRHILSMILRVKKLLGIFMKRNCKKQIKKTLE